MSMDLKSILRREAADAGFDTVRVTSTDAIPEAAGRLAAFLAAGRHGDMDWMETHAARRKSPTSLWPKARSAILLGLNYGPETSPLATLVSPDRAVISAYARGRDYHDIVKKGLKRVARAFSVASGADVKVFVDTAPLMEKPLAAAAGIGWQGKHTNLVSRTFGSWLFLGAILTTAELAVDAPEADTCGSCRRCLDACPTNAFPAPYQLDARRCIAYLTIEFGGHIAPEFREAIGNRVFGCDDCLAVCPWNKFASVARDVRLHARASTDHPSLGDILALDDAAFRERYAGTPLKRTGRDRVVRNALIAAGNAADMALEPCVRPLLADASPLVRAMAVWAYGRIAGEDALRMVGELCRRSEADAAVLAEWDAALGAE